LHGRSDQTRGGFLYHTENLPSEGARVSIGGGDRVGVVSHGGASSAALTAQLRCMAAATVNE
jgi:hypothetical protein